MSTTFHDERLKGVLLKHQVTFNTDYGLQNSTFTTSFVTNIKDRMIQKGYISMYKLLAREL